MQVFEFYFNPRQKPDLIFESFCFEPENVYEKRVGSLYIVGFLKNTLPQNNRFLDNLARAIKEKYYRLTVKNPEKALRESLREGNNFLDGISKKGDVSWLGNLSFTVLSLKNFELNFTKTGQTKIFLLREGGIIDIDKNLKFQDIEPYPLKIFGNIISGKLAENDLILVLTKEISDFFNSTNLLAEISQIIPFDEKKLNEVFKEKSEELSKIPGVCLLILLNKDELPKKKEVISLQLSKKFSLEKIFSPLTALLKRTSKKQKRLKIPKIELPKLKVPFLKLNPVKNRISSGGNKKLFSVLFLVSLLALGFFSFKN